MERLARCEPYNPVDFTQFAEELEWGGRDPSTDFADFPDYIGKAPASK